MQPVPLKRTPTKRTQQEQRPHITPQSKLVKNSTELANSIYLKIKGNTKEFKNREHTAFNKIQPNKEDLQALNEITKALVTTQPEINPTLYLQEINCAIYATADAWKLKTTPEIKAKRKPTQELTSNQNGAYY